MKAQLFLLVFLLILPSVEAIFFEAIWDAIQAVLCFILPFISCPEEAAPVTAAPTLAPVTNEPTAVPTVAPVTQNPTAGPTQAPVTQNPTAGPTQSPVTAVPTKAPTTEAVCTDATTYDVVVVGAGWAGITSAKLLKDYKTDQNPNFDFVVLEKRDDWRRIGRGELARYLMGGDGLPSTEPGNPVAELLKANFADYQDRYEEFTIVNVFDEAVATYFDSGSDVTSELANGTFADFASAYQCLIDFTDDLYDNFIGSTQDRSMRDALRDECNWPEPPADNSILRSVEYAIDYEFSSTPDIMGLYNFPTDRPNRDFGTTIGSDTADWFLTAPSSDMIYASSAQIGEAYVMANSLQDYIRDDKGVAKIFWGEDDGTDFPILVRTENSTDCYDIRTKKVIFTPSAGVLERRGDCLHVSGSSSEDDCDPATAGLPLFDPVVPRNKMDAVRRLHVDTNRPEAFASAMADYVEVIFQFSNATFLEAYPKDFLIFNEKCRYWQNHHHRFYQGSKAVSCTLNSEEWDEFADPTTKTLPVQAVRTLYGNTLGLLDGAPPLEECEELDEASASQWYPGNEDVLTTSCGYTYTPSWFEDQANSIFHHSYGSYVTWTVGDTLDSLDDDFSAFVDPMETDGVDRIYISGTAICDRHQGWVHGAYYAGIKVTQRVLQSLDASYTPTETHFCDVGPDGNYRK